jgi:RNA polymerase sigma factor (TIGR02999 family)
MSSSHEVTRLLRKWAEGRESALDALTPLVYAELRCLAESYLRREKTGHTLQPTALVHEAYLRLVDQSPPNWENRSHFYGVAARLMRQILVDHARCRRAGKRAGHKVALEDVVNLHQERSADLLALDAALKALEKIDPRKCRAIELHYFGGLSMDDVARMLGISAVTVQRDMRAAKTWLYREMRNR